MPRKEIDAATGSSFVRFQPRGEPSSVLGSGCRVLGAGVLAVGLGGQVKGRERRGQRYGAERPSGSVDKTLPPPSPPPPPPPSPPSLHLPVPARHFPSLVAVEREGHGELRQYGM